MVHLAMVSKSSAVRSIRLQNDLWQWLSDEAERRGLAVNGLVSDLLEVGRLKAEEAKVKPAAKPKDIKASHETIQKRFPKTLAKLAEAEAAEVSPPKVSVQIGPVERKPGDLMKKGKK